MKYRSLPVRGLAFLGAAALLCTATLQAQPTIYADAVGDTSTNLPIWGGTVDIVKMEVSDTETDLLFNLTVNGNVMVDTLGKFMIGIANMKAAGTTNSNGNGWSRPINLIAGPTNGMTHWVGSWVDGTTGSQFWVYNGTSWSQSGSPGFSQATNTNGTSTISYTVSKASLGVTNGDTIFFDAYSAGGGSTDSAIDALSNPNVATTTWSGPYTSSTNTGISSYLLNNSALVIPQDITFTVDMSYQIYLGNFDPEVDFVTVAGSFNGFDYTENILSPIAPESPIYSGTVAVTAAASSMVTYRFAIFDIGLFEAFPEGFNRSFQMPEEALTLPTVFFDNIQGERNVTFSVDMNVQIELATFDPNTQDVLVAGSFNNWDTSNANPPLVDEDEDGIYTGTFPIAGLEGQTISYKFYSAGMSGSGYEEDIPNRQAALELNEDGEPEPAQVLPVVFWNNQEAPPQTRDVTFTVDMSVQVELGTFTEGGIVKVTGGFNNWDTVGSTYELTDQGENIYSGTFSIPGTEGATMAYKFFSAGMPNFGYEDIPDRTFLLGPEDVPQDLGVVFWDNQASLPQSRDVTFSVDMSVQVELGTFTEGGIVKVTGSFNDWSTGGETYQLTDQGGNIYSGTFAIGGDEGSSISYKFFSPDVTTGDGYETISNRSAELGPDGDPQDLGLVFWNDYEGGMNFDTWSGGEPATPELVLKYAVGGADSPTGESTASVTDLTSTTLSITAIVRIDDPELTVEGETTDNLTTGPWTTVGVTVEGAGDGVDQTGVPEGCERKVFSVERDGDTEKFLRLKATLGEEVFEM